MDDKSLTDQLLEAIGEEALIALANEFAGTRIYVPVTIRDSQRITKAIGREAADKLSFRFAPASIRVPLLRELRARHFRAAGLSNPKIAVRLGLTETGVQKLFRRGNVGPQQPRQAQEPARPGGFGVVPRFHPSK